MKSKVFILCFTILLIFGQIVFGQEKGVKNQTVSKLPSKEKRWALIIGVDNYGLKGAVNDATALRNALVRYAGFPENQIITLTTEDSANLPNRRNILVELDKLSRTVPTDGLFLFAFSGHGKTVADNAYLIPSDGQMTNNNRLLREISIDVKSVKEAIEEMQVKQVVMLIDACRDRIEGKGNESEPLTPAVTRGFSFDEANKTVEAFITLYATRLGEFAYEFFDKETNQYRGYFSRALEEGLSGKAANEKGEVTLAGLVKYIEDTVPTRSYRNEGKRQIPWKNTNNGFKENELVLAVGKANFSSDAVTKDKKMWEAYKSSQEAAIFQLYLDECREGNIPCIEKTQAEIKVSRLMQANIQIIKDNTKPTSEVAENKTGKKKDEKIDTGINETGSANYGENFEIAFEIAIKEGNQARDDRDYLKAEISYKQAKSVNPKDSRASYGLGNIYVDQQRWEEAEKFYRQAIQLEPDSSGAYTALSFVLTQPVATGNLDQRYAEAEKMARKAIQLDPTDTIAYDQLGVALEIDGIISQETENAYRRSIQLDSSFALAYAHLGRLLRRKGLIEDSAEAYRKAIELSDDAPAMILVADVLQSQQKYIASEQMLRKALAKDPMNPTALFMLGRSLFVNGKFNEAEEILEKSLKVTPKSHIIYILLSSLFIQKGDFHKAEQTLNQALSFASQLEKRLLVIKFGEVGDGFIQMKKKQDAIRIYQKALGLDNGNKSIKAKLAKAKKK